MRRLAETYVRVVDRINRVIGRATMYLIFVMIGVLFYSSVAKTFFDPALWTLEVSQFLMVGYFLIGGAYSLQIDGHVRMDLLYSRWSPRTQVVWDAVTILFMIFYLVMLLFGSLSSLEYAIAYEERSYSIWRPYMWPIKTVMAFGIFMMLLQAISQLFKDIAAAVGEPLS